MLHFAQWLSTSFGTGDLAHDGALAVAAVGILVCSIWLLRRLSLGVKLEQLTGNDSSGMHDVLDVVQTELRTASRSFAYEVERCRFSLLRLRYSSPRVREQRADDLAVK